MNDMEYDTWTEARTAAHEVAMSGIHTEICIYKPFNSDSYMIAVGWQAACAADNENFVEWIPVPARRLPY